MKFLSKDIYTNWLNILVIIVMFNVNGIIYLFTGNTGFVSGIILLLTFFLIVSAKLWKFSGLMEMYTIFVFLYLAVGLFALLYHENYGSKSMQTIFDILKSYLLVLAVFLGFRSAISTGRFDPMTIVGYSVIASVMVSYFLYILGVTENITRYRTETRFSGIFANPNEMAAQALFSIIFCWHFLDKSRGKIIYKILLYIALLISFVSLVLAFSRSIFLALIIVALLKWLIFMKLNIKSIASAFLVVLGLLFFAPKYYNSLDVSAQKRMDATLSLTEGDFDDTATGGRIGLAEEGFELIAQNPFIGNGIGIMQHMDGVGGVHNAYLALWGNAGAFVLLYFVLFLVLVQQKLFLHAKIFRDPTLLFLMLVIIINGLTKTGVYEFKINNIILALCLAVISAGYQRKFNYI